MPDLALIIANRPSGLPTAQTGIRAALAWAAILDKPSTVVFLNSLGAKLPPQQVRLENENIAGTEVSVAGMGAQRRLVIFGVKGHPTVPDTDMQEGYVFIHDNDEYTCIDVVVTIGEIQGIWRATG